MPKVEMRWKEARGGGIQFGGHYQISGMELLEEALTELVYNTRSEDTFDLLVREVDPESNKTIRTIAEQKHGFPESLPDELRAMFGE